MKKHLLPDAWKPQPKPSEWELKYAHKNDEHVTNWALMACIAGALITERLRSQTEEHVSQ